VIVVRLARHLVDRRTPAGGQRRVASTLLSVKRCWLRLVGCRCGVALVLLVARLVLLVLLVLPLLLVQMLLLVLLLVLLPLVVVVLLLLLLLLLQLLLVCGASLLPHRKDLALRVALVEAELRALEQRPLLAKVLTTQPLPRRPGRGPPAGQRLANLEKKEKRLRDKEVRRARRPSPPLCPTRCAVDSHRRGETAVFCRAPRGVRGRRRE